MKVQTVKKLSPGLFRRLGAILYDSVLLFGVLFGTTVFLLPLNSGQAFQPDQWFYPLCLLIACFFFFGWFWTHGGQTLGMRAWKIRVCTRENLPISWNQAVVRFFTAIISWSVGGLGFLWILFNPKKLGWHDFLSRTRIDWDER